MTIAFDLSEIERALFRAAADEMQLAGNIVTRVTVLNTVVGAPETWRRPPPPGYTPGGARAGWNILIGQEPTESLYDPAARDTVGAPTIARAQTQLQQYTDRDARSERVIYLANAVPYIVPLNNGEASPRGSFFAEAGVAAGAGENTRVIPL